MKRREEEDGEDVKWSEPELSHRVVEERKPSGVQQMLAAGGVVTAMNVANVIMEQINR